MKPKFADYILAAVIAIIAALIWIIPLGENGATAQISQGEERFSVSLSKNAEYELRGCTVEVSDGEIFILKTDCPDRVCEKTGKISRAGEAIICVPQRVEIRISGDAEIDAVTG